jgi:hypothetical protein
MYETKYDVIALVTVVAILFLIAGWWTLIR